MSTTKKGFTLIELLIVIGVIGLLASMVLVGLSGFRKSGRDARRIGDMNQMRTVMERYFAQCGFYPIKADRVNATDACPNITAAVVSQPAKWMTEFGAELETAGLIASARADMPQDMLAKGGSLAERGEDHAYTYQYRAELVGVPSKALKYILRAKLEDDANAVLQNDIDNIVAGTPLPAYGGFDCDDIDGKNYYCITF